MKLTDQKIILGVTGGIAAYKAADLCRQLIKQGAHVQVVMTDAAQSFVTPLTFQALSGEAVRVSLLDPEAEQGMGHIELARWADAIIVAPASADFIARYAAGMANDLLTTLLLASTAPIYIAPAMNRYMWENPLVQDNIQALNSILPSIHWLGPDSGEQACGDVGEGRMLEPEAIVDALVANDVCPVQFVDKRVVITAGPTREAIDPVRYLSNYSSGKMGFEIARAFAGAGAKVTLVSGPVTLDTPPNVKRINVLTAEEMLSVVQGECEQKCDVFIASAAVADYRPVSTEGQKLKKTGKKLSLELTENPDILAWVGQSCSAKPFVVGFAAETQDVLSYAEEKRVRKGVDLMVANDVSKSDIGFGSDFNAVTMLWQQGSRSIERASKRTIAEEIMKTVHNSMELKKL